MSTSTIILWHRVASGERSCVRYLQSPWFRLVPPGGIYFYPQAPGTRPHTQDASLCSMRLDRRAHREYRLRPGVTSLFLLMYPQCHPMLSTTQLGSLPVQYYTQCQLAFIAFRFILTGFTQRPADICSLARPSQIGPQGQNVAYPLL